MKSPHLSAFDFSVNRLSRQRAQAIFAVCLLMLLVPFYGAAQDAVSVPSFAAPADKSTLAQRESLPLAVKVARGEAPLSKLYTDIKLDSSGFYRLPTLKAGEIENDDSMKRMRIGITRVLPKNLEPSSDARLFSVPEGEVRLIGIVSKQALQVRVHFTDVNLPKGARIFVYSASNPEEVYGPFEGRGAAGDGEFWTPPVRGENVVIEYFEPSAAAKARSAQPFKIGKITHDYKALDGTNAYTEKAAGACNLNVTSEWSNIAKSVGRMQFVSDGGSYVCTGTLLNNQASDGTPNFLTANHCINTASEAQSLRVTWNYNSPGATSSFTDGSSLLMTGTSSDYTLVRLTGSLPGGLIFSGWSTTMPTASTPITGIHHPAGDYKRISFGNIRAGGCPGGLSCLPVGWSSGTTEGGSSGSGIWTGSPSDARLVGSLNGGAASCDNLSGSDYYGRFDTTFAAISSYLTGAPQTRPSNDDFATATAISGTASSLTGSNIAATKQPGEPPHANNAGGASVWYRWQATGSGTATLTTAGSNYDTLLAVYSGTSMNALTAIASNDDERTPDILTSRVTFNAVAGTTYYIAVDGYNGASGAIALAWNFPSSPIVTVPTEVKAWTVEGKSQGYVRLTFPDASYRLAASGAVARTGNDFAVTATIDQASGATSTSAVTTAALYELGTLPAGTYTFSFTSNRNTVQRATFTVGNPAANSIDNASTFARQHYLDFLSREPDSAGLNFWANQIADCGSNAQCVDLRRVNTSGSFFLSQEFQATGYYVYRVFKGALGRAPYYAEFLPDVAQVSQNIVVNSRLSPDAINNNKASFAHAFVQRAEFLQIYNSMTNAQVVDRLFQTTGIAPTTDERNALIAELDGGSGDLANRRARVLARIIDGIRATAPANGGVGVDQVFETRYGRAFYDAEYNRAFVQMQYFGYLRRDADQAGFDFWLAKLNRFGNYLDAEMVRSFILAAEYRARFGQP